ncbi:MAG: formate--tetrahydrofolate ligase [Candidatus Sumerlaeia bacterium]|nr:formate--tetrahydrofolate ligase [Candidatus Sumerlaeia bacterium]
MSTTPQPNDAEIARSAAALPMERVAAKAGLGPEHIEPFGRGKAKLTREAAAHLSGRPDGKLILVTAINPTPAGEGKTVTTIGLGQALAKSGRSSVVCIRQPSLGPIFGVKGGATGGGYAQVVPREDIDLHFTGDFHAVTAANNLLAACADNVVHFGNYLHIDRIVWRRVMDLCDRQLREIEVGLGGRANGWPHRTGFDITAASEVMAVLALAESLADLEARLERIVVGYRGDGDPVFAGQVGCVGAMMALLRDAIRPNLVQTLEGTPALVHCGPFGNIAHGCSSVIATRLGLKMADYVVTEAGFGADLGAEKFLHIKCRQARLAPAAAVLVASCRALRMHGLQDGESDRVAALRRGCANLATHAENLAKFGVPVVVAVNRFADDTAEELDALRGFAAQLGLPCAMNEVHARGGEGGLALAEEVARAAESRPAKVEFLYSALAPLREKIETVAREVYRADGVDFDDAAVASMELLERNGHSHLPVCMAKTQSSLSDDPKRPGAPRGWRLHVRDLKVSNGAGFVVVFCGKINLMPGMPEHGNVEDIRLDPVGEVIGLV